MSFFNEFPHTRTYDSDLAWLIKRMREVLSRMDSVEERMKALENLVNEFIDTLNIDDVIKNEIRRLINNGDFNEFIEYLFNTYQDPRVLFEKNLTRGVDWDSNSFFGSSATVTNSTLKITQHKMGIVKVRHEIYFTGGYGSHQSNSSSPTLYFTRDLKNEIGTVFKSNKDACLGRQIVGSFANAITFDTSDNMDGIIFNLYADGWTPSYSIPTNWAAGTEHTYFNLINPLP